MAKEDIKNRAQAQTEPQEQIEEISYGRTADGAGAVLLAR